MMDFLPFLLAVGAIVAAIVVVKVFFTLWRILEKRLHPEQFAQPAATPEFVFRRLHGKKVTIVLKNGERLQDCDYQSTHLFGDGEFAFRAVLYFEFITADNRRNFLAGAEILRIETDAGR